MKGTVGRVAYVKPPERRFVYSPQISYWRVLNPQVIHPRWVRYWLESPEFHRQAAATKGATDMADYINLRDQRRMVISLPPIDVQRLIAGLLGTLDDLMANNRSRVQSLEEMAQSIYRQWFVRFRYPGHDTHSFIESRLGRIPDGWDVVQLQDIATLIRGRSYRKSELVEAGGQPFINLKCMKRGGGFRRDGLKRYDGKFTEEQLARPGDIVLAVTDLTQGRDILARATLVPRLSAEAGVISLDVARVLPHHADDRLWIFAALRWSDFSDRVKEYANGSTVLHLSPTHVAEGHILLPPPQLRGEFFAFLEPSIRQIDDLLDTADRLGELRDLLLPLLVTGQIDISALDLDALVEESVA
jgi:type I restriction enzyme S subunit